MSTNRTPESQQPSHADSEQATDRPAHRNPFVGPQPLQAGDPIFGRDDERSEILDLLIAERIVVLYSPSGAGKTSLIHAGLLSDVAARNLFDIFPVVRIGLTNRPFDDPVLDGATDPSQAQSAQNPYMERVLAGLTDESAEQVESRPDTTPTQNAGSSVGSKGGEQDEKGRVPSDGKAMSLDAYLTSCESREQGWIRPQLLIFDQFEEVVAQQSADRTVKEAFFAELGEALARPHRWALFALREDYLAALDPFRFFLPSRLTNRYRLERLQPQAAQVAMRRTAETMDVIFHQDAVEELSNRLLMRRTRVQDGSRVTQVAPDIDPMHLQVVCRRIWQEVAPESEITISDVLRYGDVDEALCKFYAETVAVAAQVADIGGVSIERQVRRWIQQHLITPDGRGRNLLPYRSGHETAGLPNAIIQHLLSAQLIRVEGRIGDLWLELAHDQLVEPILLDNEAWEEANLQAFQRQAQLWDEQKREDGFLLRGEALVEAEAWAVAHPGDLFDADIAFLERSIAQRTDEARQSKQRKRILILAVASSITAVLAIILLIIAINAVRIANHERKISRSRELAALSTSVLDIDPELSLLLANEAIDVLDTRESLEAARKALATSRVQHTVELADNGDLDLLTDQHGVPFLLNVLENEVQALEILSSTVQHIALPQLPPTKWRGLDDRHVLFLTEDELVVWDVLNDSVSPIAVGAAFPQTIGPVDLADDGQILLAGVDKALYLFADINSPNESRNDVRFDKNVSRIAVDDRKMLAAIATSDPYTVTGTIHLLDLPSLTEQVTFTFPNEINALAFGPDGRYLAAGGQTNGHETDYTYLYALDKRDDKVAVDGIFDLRGHQKEVRALAFDQSGERLATGGADGAIYIWNVKTHIPSQVLRGHQGPVTALRFDPHEQLLYSSDGLTVKVWDVDQAVAEISADAVHGGATITGLDAEADGAFYATVGDDGYIRIWAGEDGALLGERDFGEQVLDVDLSAGGDRLVITGWRYDETAEGVERFASVLSVPEFLEVATFPDSEDLYFRATLSPEQDRVAFSYYYGEAASIISLAAPDEPGWLIGHSGRVNDVQFSPDGRLLATSSEDGSVRLWNPVTLQTTAVLTEHVGPVNRIDFSADGRFLATGGDDRRVIVWDMETLQPYREMPRQNDEVLDVRFADDSVRLAAASRDGTVVAWNISSGEERFQVKYTAAPTGVDFTGKDELVTVDQAGILRRHPLALPDLLTLLDQRITRDFTEEECQLYEIEACNSRPVQTN